MADYSTLFQEDPELMQRTLASYDSQHPEIQQALEQPAQAEPTQAEPVASEQPAPGPVDMQFSLPAARPTGSLGQQSQQLMNQQVESLNQQGESVQREGDAKALGASRAAQIYAQQAASADRYARAAEQTYADDQERAAKYKQYEDEDYERLRQEPPKPGMLKNAFNVITGIIGAAAGGSTADAIGMLRQHVNRSAEQDVRERAAAQERLGLAGKIHDSIIRDSSNALDASAKLVANQWLVASRQLEQIANESSVPVFREQALRLKMAAEDQARGILAQNVNAQIKAAAAQQAAMRPKWSQFTEGELAALEESGKLPAEGATVLAELRKKKRDASGEGQGGEMKAEAAKALRLYESAGRDADTMRDALKKMEATGSDDVPGVGPVAGRIPNWATSAEGTKLRRATRRLIKTMIRDESGAAISDEEAEGFMEDRGMGLTASNADFKVGMQEVLQEFEQKRSLAREAAGKGRAAEAPEGSAARNELEAALGMRPAGGAR